MNTHEKISYVEFPASNLVTTRTFFEKVFSWSFTEYGPEYSAFANAGIEGGFYQSEQTARVLNGSALIVIYSNDLAVTQSKIEQAGGTIIKPVFTFPGGARFHFTEPSGNEFAVWSDNLT